MVSGGVLPHRKNDFTIEHDIAAIRQHLHGATLLVVDEVNSDLEKPEIHPRDKEIMAAISAVGLEEILGHYLPRHRPWA